MVWGERTHDGENTGTSTPASFDPYTDGQGQDILSPPLPHRFSSTFSPQSSSFGANPDSLRDVSVEDEGLLPHLRAGSRRESRGEDAEKAGPSGAAEVAAEGGEKAVPARRKLSRRRALFTPTSRRGRLWCIGIVALLLILIAAAVAVPIGIVFGRKSASSSSGGGSGSSSKGRTTGGDGSTVTTEDGSTFTYHNPVSSFLPRKIRR